MAALATIAVRTLANSRTTTCPGPQGVRGWTRFVELGVDAAIRRHVDELAAVVREPLRAEVPSGMMAPWQLWPHGSVPLRVQPGSDT